MRGDDVAAVGAALVLLENAAYEAPVEYLNAACHAVNIGMGRGVVVPWEYFPTAGVVYAAAWMFFVRERSGVPHGVA